VPIVKRLVFGMEDSEGVTKRNNKNKLTWKNWWECGMNALVAQFKV
jgi:hypothetical protein